MSFARVAGLSIASCIFVFAACGGDDSDIASPGPDASASSSGTATSSTSSGGTSSSSSGGASSSSGDAGGDDDDASTPNDSGADAADSGDSGVSNLPPSCKAANGVGAGINTCGATETTNDDCCKTLTLPKTTTRTLDKYEITAGRMRAFIEAHPNVRSFAKTYATDHPTSQLGKVATNFPAAGQFASYLDTLPNGAADSTQPLDEALFLGGFPVDEINSEDGCFVGPGGYGAATYWQNPPALKPYGIGQTGKGDRKYSKDVLDEKSLNCVSALMLASFCAWDGGELARTSDYHEVWGVNKVTFPSGGATVYIPWTDVLPWGDFNWRNGHDGACPKGWPGCAANPGIFFSFPLPNPNPTPQDDDSPEIAAPGRFPKDVTKIVSADGSGWYDLGGNLMDLAWPNTNLVPGVQDFCDTSAGNGPTVATQCNRAIPGEARQGTLRYKGSTPPVVLVGSSFEVHYGRAAAYFASATDDETKIVAADIKPIHFQYGKIGGRCARVKP